MKPNILFFLIDSLRSDRFHGDLKNSNTPNMDKLLKNGNFFSQAISCSDYTGPSIQAIFTGKFPFGCGLTKEHYYKVFSTASNFLSLLKDNGYYTNAVLEEALCRQGIEKPFDDYFEFKSSVNIHNGLEKIILNNVPSDTRKPWFYYLHFMDLHKPCIVPKEHSHLKESQRYEYNLSIIDKCIGKILDKVDISNTLVILTADHGDYVSPIDDGLKPSNKFEKIVKSTIKSIIPKSLKSRVHEKKQTMVNEIKVVGLSPHEKRGIHTRPMADRFMFDDVVKIPLLFSGFGINTPSVISSLVRNVDIFPTIFELIKIPYSTGNINGQSLTPLFFGSGFKVKPAYMESSVIRTVQKNPKAVIGIRTEQFKYFRNIHDPNVNVHLYDLENDPHEENNISDSNSKIISDMENILKDIQATQSVENNTEVLSEEEEKELEAELKKLGYI